MADRAPFFDDLASGPPARAWWLRADDGTRLRMGLWPRSGARGTVLILPGRSEYLEKYAEAAAEFAARGWAAAAIDWRGQGLSARPLSDPAAGHVERFADYQRDVAAMVAALEAADAPRPWVLVAHSMGGAIGLRALHGGLAVRAASFSAPMWSLRLSLRQRLAARFLWLAVGLAGQGHRYAPGTGPEPYLLTAPADGNLLTADAGQYRRMRAQIATHPDLALGGPTLNWLREALAETRRLARLGPAAVPALAFLGSEEQIVDPAAVRAMMARWPRGRLIEIAGARHEILMERPAVRRRFFDETAALFATA